MSDYDGYSRNGTHTPTSQSGGGAQSKDSFIGRSHAFSLNTIAATQNASTEFASVEYKRFDISDKITFDAMTFKVPVNKTHRDKNADKVIYLPAFDVILEDFCSRQGCVLYSTTIEFWKKLVTIQPSVQVASICLNDDGTDNYNIDGKGDQATGLCNRVFNNSMLAVEIDVRLEGDVWDRPNGVYLISTRFEKLRTVYSITAGRHSWEMEDLTKAFGAKCDEEHADCEGFRFDATDFKHK